MARKCQLKVGHLPQTIWLGTRGMMLTRWTAGSALIQACEKAGVTIPR